VLGVSILIWLTLGWRESGIVGVAIPATLLGAGALNAGVNGDGGNGAIVGGATLLSLGGTGLILASLFGGLPLLALPPGTALLALAALLLMRQLLARYYRHRLGGYTGDALGMAQHADRRATANTRLRGAPVHAEFEPEVPRCTVTIDIITQCRTTTRERCLEQHRRVRVVALGCPLALPTVERPRGEVGISRPVLRAR